MAQPVSADSLLVDCGHHVYSLSYHASTEGVPEELWDILFRAKRKLGEEQILVDNLLLRFRNIVALAPTGDDVKTREAAAGQAHQLRVETAAMVKASEDLLKLSRQIKELWLGGPLRGIGEEEIHPKLDHDAEDVTTLLQLQQVLVQKEYQGNEEEIHKARQAILAELNRIQPNWTDKIGDSEGEQGEKGSGPSNQSPSVIEGA